MTYLFDAYVRPILKCAKQFWSPLNIKLINHVESVQQLFTGRIKTISH